MTQQLDIGDPAPDFDLAADGGGRAASEQLRGRRVVLYFYPRDDTPGCTKEAVGFTEKAAEFEAAGAVVVGVSKDDVASHDRFKAKHGLGVQLASDPDGDTIERYGAWVEKSMYGKKYMGIDRSTFLIDENGVIRGVWRKVRVPGHVDAVLTAARELAG